MTSTGGDSVGQQEEERQLEREPQDIAEQAVDKGRSRLDRSNPDIFITALIGGGEVSLGGLAAMDVAGSLMHAFPELGLFPALLAAGLVFPIGFLFVIIGRSELFTENFLVPVITVIRRERPFKQLLEVWGLSWVGNILGCAATAALLLVPHAIGDPILEGYRAYAEYKLALPLPGLFVSAVLAGATMTVLTWLLLAVHHAVGKMVVIFAAGYVLFATNLSHVIVGAALLFVGYSAAGFGLWDVFGWLAIATVGNMVGGLGLVTLLRVVQASEKIGGGDLLHPSTLLNLGGAQRARNDRR